MIYKHKNGNYYEFKKSYNTIIVGWKLDNNMKRIPEKEDGYSNDLDINGNKKCERRILQKKDLTLCN